MKPKSKKEQWLMRKFEEALNETDMTGQEIRHARKVYKRRRSKIVRQEGKKQINDFDQGK